MRPLEWLVVVAIAACDAGRSPTKAAVPAGSATGSDTVPKWASDPPAVLRDKINGVNAHVIVLKNTIEFSEYRDVLALAERTRGVVAAEPFIFAELRITKAGKPPVELVIKGVDPSRVGRVLAMEAHMKTGTLDSLGTTGEPPPIVLGDDLAHTLDAHVGDRVTVTSREGGPSDMPPAKPTTFRITGLFHVDFDEYDQHLALAPLLMVQEMLGRGDQVMGIEMTVSDLGHSDELAKTLEKALGGPPYQVRDWYELNKRLFTTLYGDRRP